MSNHKNQKISLKSSLGPDLSKMLITLAIFKNAKEDDIFYLHVINILWPSIDERVKNLIEEYFGELKDEKEKEGQ